jgi:CBS domain containing-hemolysin-like protein
MPTGIEITTVGGLLSESFGRIPKRGDALDWQGHRFSVVSANRRGVDLVSIAPLDVDTPDDEAII